MARIRSVHPSQWTDETFVTLSPFARLLTIALRNEADDRGVFEWKPVTIKMRIFPVDNVNVETLLGELEAANTIRKYELNGRQYGAIRNFLKFQSPKKPKWTHPCPEEYRKYVGLIELSGEPEADDDGLFPEKGELGPQREKEKDTEREKEKKNLTSFGQKKNGKISSKATRLPEDWQPTKNDIEVGLELGLNAEQITDQFERFQDYWRAKPGSQACKLDWSATFRNWLRRANDGKGKTQSI